MNKIVILSVLSLTLILSACASSNKKPPSVDEYLAVHVSEDNIKHFSYNAEVSTSSSKGSRADRKGGGERHGRRDAGERPSAEQMKMKMENRFDLLLTKKLEELEYCHDGYEITDKSISRGNAQYRGQCKDLANDKDIAKFKNKHPAENQQAS